MYTRVRKICFSVRNFSSIGEAVAEKIEFLFKNGYLFWLFFFWHVLWQLRVLTCMQDIAPLTKIDRKYDALGSKSRVANRGDPQLTALQLIIHNLVKIATKRILEIFKSS